MKFIVETTTPDGQDGIAEVTRMLDREGDFTEELHKVASIIIRLPDGTFLSKCDVPFGLVYRIQ
jgi:hypothetical protein